MIGQLARPHLSLVSRVRGQAEAEVLGEAPGAARPRRHQQARQALRSVYEALVKRILYHIVSTNFEPGIFLLWQCLSIATEFGYKAPPVHTVHSHIYHL